MAPKDEKEEEKTEQKSERDAKSDKTEEYPQPTCQDYLSYYVYQDEWKPTRPLRPIGAMSGSPGPAIVNLPPTIGEEGHDFTRTKAPGYKMGQKLIKGTSRIGPGPAAYNVRDMTNMGKETSKAPKLGKANRFSGKLGIQSPGPAAYSREDGDKFIYPKAPAFSVPKSQRGKMRSTIGPAPNAYSLPPAFGPGKTPLKVGPSYSIGKSKRNGFSAKTQSPGPAAYMLPPSNVHMNKAPAFYMGTKAGPPGRLSQSPGPASYGVQLVKFDKYSTPRITFGIKHSPYKAQPGFAAEN